MIEEKRYASVKLFSLDVYLSLQLEKNITKVKTLKEIYSNTI